MRPNAQNLRYFLRIFVCWNSMEDQKLRTWWASIKIWNTLGAYLYWHLYQEHQDYQLFPFHHYPLPQSWSKKFLVQKNFWSKKFLVQKNFGPKNSLSSKENFGPRKCWSKNKYWSKKNVRNRVSSVTLVGWG